MRKKMTEKIIWGVNPFQDREGLWKTSLKLLSLLSLKTGWSVEAVYIAHPYEPNLRTQLGSPDFTRLHEEAVRILNEAFGDVRGINLTDPRVFLERDPSVSIAVKRFGQYAKTQRAKLIVVATQARKGIPRFFMGSFAETLLFYTRTPLCLINPSIRMPARLDRVLFPTDLSSASFQTFQLFCPLARLLEAEVLLFNIVSTPDKWVLERAGLKMGEGLGQYRKYLASEVQDRTHAARRFLTLAKKQGLACSFEAEAALGSADEDILNRARKKKAQLIALASQSGRLKAGLLGSTARKIMRESTLPVWVSHP